jgi:hypothetical protein
MASPFDQDLDGWWQPSGLENRSKIFRDLRNGALYETTFAKDNACRGELVSSLHSSGVSSQPATAPTLGDAGIDPWWAP